MIKERKLVTFYILKVQFEEFKQNTSNSEGFKELSMLASKLQVTPDVSIAGYATEGEESIPTDYIGRVSVMLPLPMSPATVTGMPVIVNAFFALSENRRVLKWETNDDHSAEVQWNSKLLELLVPYAYSEFLAHLALLEPQKKIFQYWPKQSECPWNPNDLPNWSTCSEETVRLLLKKPCLQNVTGKIICPADSKEKLVIFSGKGIEVEEDKHLFRKILTKFRKKKLLH